jgi:hypothetical protein
LDVFGGTAALTEAEAGSGNGFCVLRRTGGGLTGTLEMGTARGGESLDELEDVESESESESEPLSEPEPESEEEESSSEESESELEEAALGASCATT